MRWPCGAALASLTLLLLLSLAYPVYTLSDIVVELIDIEQRKPYRAKSTLSELGVRVETFFEGLGHPALSDSALAFTGEDFPLRIVIEITQMPSNASLYVEWISLDFRRDRLDPMSFTIDRKFTSVGRIFRYEGFFKINHSLRPGKTLQDTLYIYLGGYIQLGERIEENSFRLISVPFVIKAEDPNLRPEIISVSKTDRRVARLIVKIQNTLPYDIVEMEIKSCTSLGVWCFPFYDGPDLLQRGEVYYANFSISYEPGEVKWMVVSFLTPKYPKVGEESWLVFRVFERPVPGAEKGVDIFDESIGGQVAMIIESIISSIIWLTIPGTIILIGIAGKLNRSLRIRLGIILTAPMIPSFLAFGNWKFLFTAVASVAGWVMMRSGRTSITTPSKRIRYVIIRIVGGIMVISSYLIFVSEIMLYKSPLLGLMTYLSPSYTLIGLAALSLTIYWLIQDLKSPAPVQPVLRSDRTLAALVAEQQKHDKKPIDVIVDGSNVLLYGSSEGAPRPDLSNLVIVLRALRGAGLSFHVILDAAERHRLARESINKAQALLLGELTGIRLKPNTTAAKAIEALVSAGLASYAPAGVDADHFIIRFAYNLGSMILSNDMFREYRESYYDIDERRITFVILAGRVEFSPSLEEVRDRLLRLKRRDERDRQPRYIG